MACIRATPLVCMMVVAVAAIMVADNGRLCSAFDMSGAKNTVMNKAEEAKDTAGSWGNWAYSKISGKLSVDPDLGQITKNLKSSDDDDDSYSSSDSGSSSKLVHTVSHTGDMKDDTSKFYAQAKKDAGSEYESLAKKPVTED